jgi:hypothetical protein
VIITELPADIQTGVQPVLERLKKAESNHQIALLPATFRQTLRDPSAVPARFDESLGLATLLGWITYTLYDDVLDDRSVEKLPIANIFLRRLVYLTTDITNELVPAQSLSSRYALSQLFDQIETANYWEVSQTRFQPKQKLEAISIPNYGDYAFLAERSIGHAIGPMLMLITLGYRPQSKAVKQLLAFFRHYLIARQLNDDAHDWETDLAHGHINSVAAQLLKTTQLKPKQTISSQRKALRQQFWQTAIVESAKLILAEVNQARTILRHHPLLKQPNSLEQLLGPLEQAAQQVLAEHQKMTEFIDHYTGSKADSNWRN